MFERIGDTTPPCGQPLSVASRYCQSSRYPALSMLRDQPQEPVIVDLLRQGLTMMSWFKDPKQSEMSPSMNHTVPVQVPGHFPQRGVASAPFPEPVRAVGELRLIVGLQEEAYHLAEQFI